MGSVARVRLSTIGEKKGFLGIYAFSVRVFISWALKILAIQF